MISRVCFLSRRKAAYASHQMCCHLVLRNGSAEDRGNTVRRFDEKDFRAIGWAPESDELEWLLGAEDAVKFLQHNANCDEQVIYASASAVLIHGVLAPTKKVTPADQADLLRSHVMLDDSWCIQKAWGGGQGHRIYLEPPLSSPGCKSLVGGEKLIYRREFMGVDSGSLPIELSQKLVHS